VVDKRTTANVHAFGFSPEDGFRAYPLEFSYFFLFVFNDSG
jgi:hypothetical protein